MNNWKLTLSIQHIKTKFGRVPHNTSKAKAKWNCLLCQRCATLRTESAAPLYPAPLECLPRPGLVIQVTPDLWSKVPARRSRLSFLIYNPSLPLVLFNPNLPWSTFSPDLTSSMLRKYWKHQFLFAFLIKTMSCPLSRFSLPGNLVDHRSAWKARCPNSFSPPPSKGCYTLFGPYFLQ